MNNIVIIPSFKKELDNIRNKDHLRAILKAIERIRKYGLRGSKSFDNQR